MSSRLVEFMDSLGGDNDPHDCWQEDGFHPNRVNASAEDLYVWVSELSNSYIDNGGLEGYLDYISGRTLPELLIGFEVLNCTRSADVCKKLLDLFGKNFPRKDRVRQKKVAKNSNELEKLEEELFHAMEADQFNDLIEEYAKNYFEKNQ